MNSYRRGIGGYTIVEVIIVLTVSALLFASAVVAYNQQNNRTQFTNGVNNFAQEIQSTLSDVQNGFYPSNDGFTCTADPSGVINSGYPYFPIGSAKQGTNTDCTFIGKAIQFGPFGTNKMAMDVYTLVGRRLVIGSDSDPAVKLADEKPVGLDNLVDRKYLDANLQVTSVKSSNGVHKYSGFAMVSGNTSGSVSTGLNARANLATISGNINNSKTTFLNRIRLITTSNVTAAAKGLDICIKEGGTGGRSAVIELAAGESQIIVNTKIDEPCS